MHKLRRTFVFGLAMVGLLVGVMLVGCSNKIKGTERKNSPPSISFANVPPESTTFSATPQVYWNATDIDGYITKYQYAVIISSKIDSLWGSVDSASSILEGIPPSMWLDSLRRLDPLVASISAKETESSIVKVQLFSGQSETDSIRQYLFVRAVDDDSAISNVIHRMFSRYNHKPKTHINYTSFYSDGKVIAQYSLPETTYTWKGIKIAWEGSDSDDYKGAQPNFLYKWELYGPFADTNIQLDTTVLKASGRLVDVSLNESDSTRFIEDKNLLLPRNNKALVNYPNIVPNYQYPDSGYGWYLFVIWTMDDAFALSSSLDTTTNPYGHLWLKAIHPQFSYQDVKKILVLDFTQYQLGCEQYLDSVRNFYNRAFNNLVSSDICDNFVFADSSKVGLYLSGDSLSRYNLLVYLSEGRPRNFSSELPYFSGYLNIGGKVWAIGNGAGIFGIDVSDNKYLDFTQSYDFPLNYFGLIGMYNAVWSSLPGGQNEEFIGARTDNLNLPYSLKMDSVKVANQLKNTPTYTIKAPRVPFVGYTVLGSAERICTFISADSTTSFLHLKPCGSVYDGPLDLYGNPIFKTAHMSFPLHLMQEGTSGATRDSLFEGMVEWFWED